MYKEGRLENLECMSGSSAGSLVVIMCLLFDFDFWKILDSSLKVPLSSLNKTIKWKDYGIVDAETVSSIMKTVIPDVTFREMYEKHPIKVYISGMCVELLKVIYFSVDTHPDMKIIDALRISISVPFVFPVVKYNDWTYIDSGFLEEYPAAPFLDQIDDTFVLRIDCPRLYTIKNIWNYMSNLFDGLMSMRTQYKGFKIHRIDLGDFNYADINMSEDSKMKMFVRGFLSV